MRTKSKTNNKVKPKSSGYSPRGIRLGRRPKPDKGEKMQITCVLKRATVERLRAGAASRLFGEFLQAHLDRFPPPSREEYLALKTGEGVPYYALVKRPRTRVLNSLGHSNKDKKLAKEAARRERLSPEKRAWDDSIRETVIKSLEKA